MNTFSDRRAHSRLPFADQVLLDIEGRAKPLTVAGVDVSHSGACLKVPLTAPLSAGTRISVRLPRPGPSSQALDTQLESYPARVIRVDRSSRLLEGLALVGLQFN